jgi:hypothetical protein
LFFHAFQKYTSDIWAFEPHVALFHNAETEQIDTPIPDELLIDEREFLVFVRTKYHTHTGML